MFADSFVLLDEPHGHEAGRVTFSIIARRSDGFVALQGSLDHAPSIRFIDAVQCVLPHTTSKTNP